jgi:hypothetical protein
LPVQGIAIVALRLTLDNTSPVACISDVVTMQPAQPQLKNALLVNNICPVVGVISGGKGGGSCRYNEARLEHTAQ